MSERKFITILFNALKARKEDLEINFHTPKKEGILEVKVGLSGSKALNIIYNSQVNLVKMLIPEDMADKKLKDSLAEAINTFTKVDPVSDPIKRTTDIVWMF